jgi:hypothetical protein
LGHNFGVTDIFEKLRDFILISKEISFLTPWQLHIVTLGFNAHSIPLTLDHTILVKMPRPHVKLQNLFIGDLYKLGPAENLGAQVAQYVLHVNIILSSLIVQSFL